MVDKPGCGLRLRSSSAIVLWLVSEMSLVWHHSYLSYEISRTLLVAIGAVLAAIGFLLVAISALFVAIKALQLRPLHLYCKGCCTCAAKAVARVSGRPML
eukprot:363731-Chlamydomonas_euryale.AAC.1